MRCKGEENSVWDFTENCLESIEDDEALGL